MIYSAVAVDSDSFCQQCCSFGYWIESLCRDTSIVMKVHSCFLGVIYSSIVKTGFYLGIFEKGRGGEKGGKMSYKFTSIWLSGSINSELHLQCQPAWK